MKQVLEGIIRPIPFFGYAVEYLYSRLSGRFRSSPDYWQRRYEKGGISGVGSLGRLAEFKAKTLNDFVAKHDVDTVLELGCGDGCQLSLADYPDYTGVDVAHEAVRICREKYRGDPAKRFFHIGEKQRLAAAYDLTISLDVIYHLIEDDIFEDYMSTLFGLSGRLVVIYSSNVDEKSPSRHVRHRRFTDWVDANADGWTLLETIENAYPFDPRRPHETSFSNFHIFGKRQNR